jgi:hypothetical protein
MALRERGAQRVVPTGIASNELIEFAAPFFAVEMTR